jgi:outer membrane protein assembly factor BamB
VANRNGLSALRLELDRQKMPSLSVIWKNTQGGTSPIIANNLLYYASSHEIRVLDPATGKQLWRSPDIGAIHWESPIAVKGMLFITDENGGLTAFAP